MDEHHTPGDRILARKMFGLHGHQEPEAPTICRPPGDSSITATSILKLVRYGAGAAGVGDRPPGPYHRVSV